MSLNINLEKRGYHQNTPNAKEIEIFAAIPVSFQERENIRKTLELYRKQTLDRSKFLIGLDINKPCEIPNNNKSWLETLAYVQSFFRENPDINYILNIEPNNEAFIGGIRNRIAFNVMNTLYNVENKNDLIIVSNDADCEDMHSNYLKRYLDLFTNFPCLNLIIGDYDLSMEEYKGYPELKIFIDFQKLLVEELFKSVFTNGFNFAIRSSTFTHYLGFDSTIHSDEDFRFGHSIQKDDPYSVEFIEDEEIKIITSGRRFYSLAQKAKIYTYDDFIIDPVRNLPRPKELKLDKKTILQIVMKIESLINEYIRITFQDTDCQIKYTTEIYFNYLEKLKKIFKKLGIDSFIINNNFTIKIKKANTMIKRLTEFLEE